MQIPRWRNVLIFKNSLIPALSQSIPTRTHFASIHSTPITCEKWKSKRDCDERGSQQPSKAYIRYSIRQKPSATKRALQGLLYNSGVSRSSFQHIEPIQSFDAKPSVGSIKKKLKANAQRAKKYHQDRMRSKLRRESFSDDFGDPETISRATFGNKRYMRCNKSFRSEPSGFEWREPLKWKNRRYKGWDATSETEYDNTSYSVGSHYDRTVLGLPPTGPLKIEDVKNAFRLSALKWHPDKHQDASLAVAEEKFKLCVNAYKSICDALTCVKAPGC